MIVQNYNHPAVFTWGIFNEVSGGQEKIAGELNDIVHEFDRFARKYLCHML